MKENKIQQIVSKLQKVDEETLNKVSVVIDRMTFNNTPDKFLIKKKEEYVFDTDDELNVFVYTKDVKEAKSFSKDEINYMKSSNILDKLEIVSYS